MAKIRTIEEARAFRAKIEGAALHIPEEQALESIELFPKWDATKDYVIGEKVRHGDKIYKCYNTITANPTWTPDVVPAHWEVLAKPEEEGTLNNPIAAAVGMRYFKDKYYLEGENIYLCIRDDLNGEGTILHYWPSVLVGNYFTKVEKVMPKFLDKIVMASIGLTILGGLIAVIFQWATGMELSPTLIQYWFTVFGIELGATTLITLTKTLTKTYEKKVELQLMDKYKIEPNKEDLKFIEDLTSHWNVGNSYIDPIDFTYKDDEVEG